MTNLHTNISVKMASLLILCLLYCTASIHADDQQASDKVAAAVALLGDERSEVRNDAHANLERMLRADENIAEQLETYKNHDDPEIATRISALLKKQQEALLAQQNKAALLLALKKQNAKLTVLEKQADGVLRLDPANENMARSMAKGDAKHKIKMQITNQSKQAISISTICSHSHKKEGGGNRKNHFKKLDPGQTHKCAKTYENRYYVLADMDKKILGLYLTGDEDATIIFKGVPPKKK
jgi:hypothetical protein